MAIPTPRLSVYRDKATGELQVQPCGLDKDTGAQPECWKPVRIQGSNGGDALAMAVLELLPVSLQPLESAELVRQTEEERRKWIRHHDSIFIEMPRRADIRIVLFRNEQDRYVASARTIRVSMDNVKKDIGVLTTALRRALARSAT